MAHFCSNLTQYSRAVSHKKCIDLIEHQVKCLLECSFQRWSRGHKARGQGQGHKKNPRPRTAFPRTDTLEAKDRNTGMLETKAKDQGHKRKCSPKKKRSSQKFFKRSPQKKRFPYNFSSAPQNFNNSKNSAFLEPRTGQFSRT